MSEEYQHEQAINMNVVIPSRRERLRRPLPSPPVADPSNRGSMGGGGAAVAAAAAGVRGVVASRLAAMASAGSTTSTATNGVISSDPQQHKLSGSYSVDSGASSRIPSYRLSSLDRLAQRQRLFESGPAPPTSSSATNGTTPSLNIDPSVALVS